MGQRTIFLWLQESRIFYTFSHRSTKKNPLQKVDSMAVSQPGEGCFPFNQEVLSVKGFVTKGNWTSSESLWAGPWNKDKWQNQVGAGAGTVTKPGEGNKENVLCMQRGAGACSDGKEAQMGHGKDPGTCQDGRDTAPGLPFWGPIILQQQRQTGTAPYTVHVEYICVCVATEPGPVKVGPPQMDSQNPWAWCWGAAPGREAVGEGGQEEPAIFWEDNQTPWALLG